MLPEVLNGICNANKEEERRRKGMHELKKKKLVYKLIKGLVFLKLFLFFITFDTIRGMRQI